MYINEDYIIGIVPIFPQSINSTMFTECCEVAICVTEKLCPNCKRVVIGHDFPEMERGKIRWENATRNWKKP